MYMYVRTAFQDEMSSLVFVGSVFNFCGSIMVKVLDDARFFTRTF